MYTSIKARRDGRGAHGSLLIAAAVALIASAGCGGGGGSNNSGSGGTACSELDALCGADPTTLTATATTPEGLTATLTQSAYAVQTSNGADNSDTYAFALQNNTSAAITVSVSLDSSSNIIFPGQVVVSDSQSVELDQLLPPNGTSGPIGLPEQVTIQPHGTLLAQPTLMTPAFVPPHAGRFSAIGYILLDGHTTMVGPLTLSAH